MTSGNVKMTSPCLITAVIARQKVQLKLLLVRPNPRADPLGVVHRMPVHDQVHLASRELADKPAQEVDAHRPVERPGEQPKAQQPATWEGGGSPVAPRCVGV